MVAVFFDLNHVQNGKQIILKNYRIINNEDPGGVRLYQANYPEVEVETIADAKKEDHMEQVTVTNKIRLDCCGMQCPGPIMEVFRSIKEMKDGELLEVSASDPGFAKDIASWCKRTGNTLVSASSNEKTFKEYGGNKDAAREVGKVLAERAVKKDIKTVVFDRGGYVYQGRVAELAEGAREGGLEF